jgi:hypothetical protein
LAIQEKIIVTAEDRASQAFKKAGGSFTEMSDKIGRFAAGAGVGLAVSKLAELGGAAIKMAIDAGEAASAFATTFGPATDRVGRFVDEFANKAGFASFELEQMLAVTGNVVQGLGATEKESADLSITMATLAGDVASFSNAQGGAQGVMAALQSAINGETEALKTYGLAISQTEVVERALLDTGKQRADELTRHEKALATVAVAYDKAGKAVGDLDRTQDSAANTLRELAARGKEVGVQFGQAMLPAVEEILGAFDELTEEGHLLDQMIDTLADGVGDSADDMGTWAKALAIIEEKLGLTGTATEDTTTSLLRQIPVLGQLTPAVDWLVEKYEELQQAEIDAAVAARGEVHDSWMSLKAAGVPLGIVIGGVTTQLSEAEQAAIDAGIAFRVDLVSGMQAGITGVEGAIDQLDVTLDEFEENLEERVVQQAMFYENLTLLAAAGMGDLATILEEGGVENAGIVADFVDDMGRAASLEDVIDQAKRDSEDLADAYASALENPDATMFAKLRSLGWSLADAIAFGFTSRQLGSSLLGILNGATNFGVDEQAGRGGGGGLQVFQLHSGGVVPGILGGGPVPAILQPGEIVSPPQDFADLTRAVMTMATANRDGGGNVNIDLQVTVHGDADGQKIGREIEAYLASSRLLRVLPEVLR